jgi:hypothetical protein
MQTEKQIEGRIRRAAEAAGWVVLKIAGGPHQVPGIPDLLCLKDGRAVWLETKTPGQKATPKQAAMMAMLSSKARTPCEVVSSVEAAVEFLRPLGAMPRPESPESRLPAMELR